MKIFILIFCLIVSGCAATPPQSGICLGSELDCRLAELERKVKENEDYAILCRRNADWAICKL